MVEALGSEEQAGILSLGSLPLGGKRPVLKGGHKYVKALRWLSLVPLGSELTGFESFCRISGGTLLRDLGEDWLGIWGWGVMPFWRFFYLWIDLGRSRGLWFSPHCFYLSLFFSE